MGCPMERRNFLFSLCAVGGTAVTLTAAPATAPKPRLGRCKIVNSTNRTIYLKIVGAIPGLDSHSARGGILFPEEEYFDNLGEGKRVVIAWDHTGEKVVTMKEVSVLTPCRIEVFEGDAVVSYELWDEGTLQANSSVTRPWRGVCTGLRSGGQPIWRCPSGSISLSPAATACPTS